MKIEQGIVRPSRVGMTLHERDIRVGDCYLIKNRTDIHKRVGNTYAIWFTDTWTAMSYPLWASSGAYESVVTIVKDPSI